MMKRFEKLKPPWPFWLVVFLCILAAPWNARSCTTPVYQYALEKWKPDTYNLVVAYRDALTSQQQEMVEQLRSCPITRTVAVKVRHKDLRLPFAPPIKNLPPDLQPTLYLFAPPGHKRNEPIWSAALNSRNVRRLVSSPVCDELFRRVKDGHSVVWLAVTSGDPEKDQPFLRNLEEKLNAAADQINAPPNSDNKVLAKIQALAKPKTVVRFSVLPLDPDDAEENILAASLRTLDPASTTENEIVAIPVFGRGRALEAIPAASLNKETIAQVSRFLTGFCSCQIKEKNPGKDLFIPVDWEKAIAKNNEKK